MSDLILLTDATGDIGHALAGELQQRGLAYVVLAGDVQQRAELQAAGHPTVEGDLDRPVSLRRAFQGVRKAYLACPPDEKMLARETAFVMAAREAGVAHIVKCSAYGAGSRAASLLLRTHGVSEKVLMRSGVPYTIIRPQSLMQTYMQLAWNLVYQAHVLTLPAGAGRIPLVDARDVARVAGQALTEGGHAGRLYEVTGPEALGGVEQAAAVGRVLGRPVVYRPGSERHLQWLLSTSGVTVTHREHLLRWFALQRARRLERVHATQMELGLTPTPFEVFLRDAVSTCAGIDLVRPLSETWSARVLDTAWSASIRLQLQWTAGRSRLMAALPALYRRPSVQPYP